MNPPALPIFGSFPPEMSDHIISFLTEDNDVACLARTCKALHAVFNPFLYERAVLTNDFYVALWAARENQVGALRNLLEHFPPGTCGYDLYVLRPFEGKFHHGPVGVETRRRTGRYWGPVHEAARCGAVEAMRFLLEHGADVDSPSACYCEDRFPVGEYHYWVDFGGRADFAARPMIELTPLVIAILYHQPAVCELLLRRGASVQTTFTRDGQASGATALHMAAAVGAAPIVRQLVELGRQHPDVEDAEGHPPLMWSAVMEDGTAAMRALVEVGADLDYMVPSRLDRADPEARHTMVATLTRRRKKDAAAKLISFGAAPDPEEGK